MSYIEDVRKFLRRKSVTYLDLLELLIQLERQHARTTLKIQMGVLEDMGDSYGDMRNAIKMARIANRLKVKIEKKLNE